MEDGLDGLLEGVEDVMSGIKARCFFAIDCW